MCSWVSVKERKPKSPGMYLISYNPRGEPGASCVQMAYRFTFALGKEYAYDYWCQWLGCDDIEEDCVTYWADIEAPPDSKEKVDEPLRAAEVPA